MTSLMKLLFPDPDIPMRAMTISSGIALSDGPDFLDIVDEILDGELQGATANKTEKRDN